MTARRAALAALLLLLCSCGAGAAAAVAAAAAAAPPSSAKTVRVRGVSYTETLDVASGRPFWTAATGERTWFDPRVLKARATPSTARENPPWHLTAVLITPGWQQAPPEFSVAGVAWRTHLSSGADGPAFYERLSDSVTTWLDPRPLPSWRWWLIFGIPTGAFAAATAARIRYLRVHAPDALHPTLLRKKRKTGAFDRDDALG